ncbi:MAG: ATP-binding protein [Clostridiales bacterium]|nr:ATP-binding protein [Clostridiales bacterium]
MIILLVVMVAAGGSFFSSLYYTSQNLHETVRIESPEAAVRHGLVTSALLFVVVGAALSAFLSGIVVKPYHTIREQAASQQGEHERMRLLLDAMPLACRLWNKEYRIIEINEAAVKLFKAQDKEQVLAHYFSFSPEYQPDGRHSVEKTNEVLKKAFAEGGCVLEWMHQASDGEPIPTEITLMRVVYAGEDVLAGYTRDLREHNRFMTQINDASLQLEAALLDAQRANNAKSEFLAKMSHEMRTPLNAVIGLSGLSLEDDSIHAGVRANLEKIYSSGATLLNTVNDILDISKIEAGKLDLTPTAYDVPSLINDCVTQNIIRIGDKPIRFILDVSEDMYVSLIGDELRIRQIMNNLLSNAIKYTEEGEVELSIRCDEDADRIWLSLKVRDTGIGIREENMGHLFSDYSQMDPERNREIEGTGLGLPITKKLAELMDGSVGVESEYGLGSVFSVRLRQAYVSDARIGRDVVESLKRFGFSDLRYQDMRIQRISLPYARVLIVDDNITNLDVAKGMMTPYGMQVDCVTGGLQAVEAIRSERVRYNAIFMDQMMPGMDGIEAMIRIREIGTEYAQNIPMIAFTANAVSGNEEMLLRSGFQAFLLKPIDMARLDETIHQWIRDEVMEREAEAAEGAGQQGAGQQGAGQQGAGQQGAGQQGAGQQGAGQQGAGQQGAGQQGAGQQGAGQQGAGQQGAEQQGAGQQGAGQQGAGQQGTERQGTERRGAERRGTEQHELDLQAERRSISTRRSGLDRRLVNKLYTGLDIAMGVERFGGDEEIYMQVLRSYCENTKPLLDQMESVSLDTLPAYSMIAHGIKGSSHGIFADMIGDTAEKLELAAKAGEYDFVSTHNESFLFAVRKLIHDLEDMLASIDRANPKPKKRRPDIETLYRLIRACEVYDMDGVDEAVAELEQYEYDSDEGLANWIKDNVKRMNFKEIIARLTE